MNVENDPLGSLFLEKLNQWKTEREEEHNHLMGELMLWGSVIPGGGTLWEAIKDQILFKAEKMELSPEQVIKHLFVQKDAEAWMLAFQLSTG